MKFKRCKIVEKNYGHVLKSYVTYVDQEYTYEFINCIALAISACKNGHFGDNCDERCTCDLGNTEICQPNNGTCICKTGWQGDTCSDDVDECSGVYRYHCTGNSSCENTDGTFRCICDTGFEKSGSVCIGMKFIILILQCRDALS